MRTSQTLTLEISEKRGELSTVTEKLNQVAADGGEPNADDVSKADTLTREIRSLEVRYRAAIIKEDEEDRAAGEGDPNAEPAKLRELEARCSVTAFLAEAVSDKDVKGAEAEFRSEVLGEAAAAPGFMPIRLLDTPSEHRSREARDEHRAVTPVAGEATGLGSQADILPRIFTRTVANRLGVSMPSVPMGTRTWPVMLSGTTASMQEPSGEQDAVAGSFGGFELSPLRLTGSYEFRVEDLQLLRGLEEALRRDLRMVIADQMDHQVINGSGRAPAVKSFLSGVANTGIADPPDPAATVLTFAEFYKAFTDGVDGFYSTMLSDIRAVIGALTYGTAETLYRSADSENTAYQVLSRLTGGMSVSSRMPHAVANKVQDAIFARAGFPGTTAVAPVWEAVQLIRDPYTLAQKGEVRITMLMLWNFQVIRGEAFYRRRFRSVA